MGVRPFTKLLYFFIYLCFFILLIMLLYYIPIFWENFHIELSTPLGKFSHKLNNSAKSLGKFSHRIFK